MKFLIFLIIFYLLQSNWVASIEDDEENAKKECLKAYNVTSEELDNIPLSKQKIIYKCIYEKIGAVKDNIIQLDYIQDKYADLALTIKYALSICKNIGRGDPNDVAYELNECITEIDMNYFVRNCVDVCIDCKDKAQLSKDEFATMQYLPLENVTEPMKLYAKCILEEYNYLKDNVLQEEEIMNELKVFMDERTLKAFIKKCKAIKGNNEVDTVFQLYKYIEKMSDKYILYIEDEYKIKQLACMNEQNLEANEIFGEQATTQPISVLKKFANCVFEKMNFIKDGIIQPLTIYRSASRAKYTLGYFTNISKCINFEEIEEPPNRDMVAYNFAKCVGLFSGVHFVKDFEKAGTECNAESIFDEDYSEMNADNPTPAKKYYAACVFKKLNFLKDNKMQTKVIARLMQIYKDWEHLGMFLRTCRKIIESDHKDTAFKQYVCLDNILYDYGDN